MAVAEVIEARAYFRKRGTESPGSPRPQKRQRLQTPMPEDALPHIPLLDIAPPDPLPSPAPTLPSMDPAISRAVHGALSAPWTGPASFHYGDDDVFEDSSDDASRPAQPTPITGPTEPESSDTDLETDMDDDDPELSGSEVEEVPDILETNADLNAAEYSECTAISSHQSSELTFTNSTAHSAR